MYYITVSNGLLEGNHQKRMGSSVWQFMWCLDKITVIKENGEGKVWGGKPIKLSDIKGASRITNSRNLNKLEKLGYLKLIHTPYGISIIVYKAKKIFGSRVNNNDKPKRFANNDKPLINNDKPNKTIHLDSTTKTLAETSSALKVKKKNMKTYDENKHSDEGIPEMSYETNEPITSKPQTKKYPNALKVFNLFGKYPANWKLNRTQLQSAENLFSERGVEQIIKALTFFKENKDNEFCPQINSPYDMDSKWAKLIGFKRKQ